MKKDIFILGIVVLQIFLMISFSFSQSYIISGATPKIIETSIKEKSDFVFDLIKKGTSVLVSFFSISQIGSVSAADLTSFCCPEVKLEFGGGSCQPMLSEQAQECEVNLVETSCDNYGPCRPGCCYDSSEGTCASNTPQKICEESLSSAEFFENSPQCTISECEKGCCVLEDGGVFETRQMCKNDAGENYQFLDIDEISCLNLQKGNVEGACITGSSCTYTSNKNCLDNNGRFFPNLYCTNEDLEQSYGYNYEPNAGKDCRYGDIYEVDSRGNKERLIQNCDDYEESCEIGSDGQPYCKSLNCEDAYFRSLHNGRNPKNGDSWCIYEGVIDEGHDTVGSEQWLAECVNGEVTHPYYRCGDARSAVCQEVEHEEAGKKFVSASCVPNQASLCLTYQLQYVNANKLVDNQSAIDACEENTHCWIDEVNVDSDFKFKMCLPRYPKGADQKSGQDENLCSNFAPTCTVVYEKKNSFDGWDCYKNCDCEKIEFVEKMNEVCYSLGDCGSYVNYAGGGTDNYEVSGNNYMALEGLCNSWNFCEGGCGTGNNLLCDFRKKICDRRGECDEDGFYTLDAEKVDFTDYVQNSVDVNDLQSVEPQDTTEFLAGIFGEDFAQLDPESPEYQNKFAVAIGKYGMGALGVAYFGAGKLGLTYTNLAPPVTTTITTLGTITFAAVGAAIGLGVGAKIAEWLGIDAGFGSWAIPAGGAAGGAWATLSLAGVGTGPLGWIALGLIGIGSLFGKSYKEKTVTFQCMAWQAPVGGDDCEKCNDNSDKPCTKYRCESLGQACQLINENEENPLCIAMEPEEDPPVMTPLAIDEKHDFFNKDNQNRYVEVRTKNRDCIKEFSPVNLVFETDEAAQCKWSPNGGFQNLTSMPPNWPVEGTAYTFNHSFNFYMPSVGDLDAEDINGDVTYWYGNLTYFITCKDYFGNQNRVSYTVNFCVDSGPDENPVNHYYTKYFPPKDSYLKYGATNTTLSMFINEPAECRYSTESGTEFDLMTNEMNCVDDINARSSIWGYLCSTTLENLEEGENDFYIRCFDHPNETNTSSRNANREDEKYTIFVSEDELEISEIVFEYGDQTVIPGGTIKDSVEPVSVEMIVKTAKGSNNGVATCSWSTVSDGTTYPFFNTNAKIHTQRLDGRMSGVHTNYISCVDSAGNTASAVANFTLDLDTHDPTIIRAYHSGSYLRLITDEEAKCYYETNPEVGCTFNIENKTAINSWDTVHYADWNPDSTYYVKCEDRFGNDQSDCEIIVRASDII